MRPVRSNTPLASYGVLGTSLEHSALRRRTKCGEPSAAGPFNGAQAPRRRSVLTDWRPICQHSCMPRPRNNDLWDELATSPWWVSIVAAVVVFLFIRLILPSIAGSNILLRPLAQALYNVAWLVTLPFLLMAGVSALRSQRRRDLLDSRTGLESLRALSWQDFERLVGEAYRRQGYAVEEVGGSAPDGGIDLLLYRQGAKAIVQCKRWRTAQVGVALIREFFGVTVAENAARGIFVTTGTYTPDASAFARGKPLELVDGEALARLLRGVQLAQSGQEIRPRTALACPRCGSEMVRRMAQRGAHAGREFWGCRRYPGCTGIRSAQ